jgi:hypothetical protein
MRFTEREKIIKRPPNVIAEILMSTVTLCNSRRKNPVTTRERPIIISENRPIP